MRHTHAKGPAFVREKITENCNVASDHSVSASDQKSVLIVDDSQVIRLWLKTTVSSDPRLNIVGEASNAVEARDFLRAQRVDVITLDIEMPGMSGLEFLTRLMRARPTPVVMLSSLTSKGSDAAIQALSRGAIDCILKPTAGYDQNLSRDICERIYQAACTRPAPIRAPKPASVAPVSYRPGTSSAGAVCRRKSLVLIGASTGGVSALETVLPDIEPDGAPVVIVQHMPGNFLESFAARLAKHLPHAVRLADDSRPLLRGEIVLAPGAGRHTQVVRKADGWYCRFTDNEPAALHCPSVDQLFLSAVSHGKNVTAVILTGLGRDGADGMVQLAKAGASTIGQDEDTSVVYGMPRAAYAAGAVQQQLPIEDIGAAINQSFHARRRAAMPQGATH